MATATQPLPLSPTPRITQDIRIAVGRKQQGKKAPERLDHFLLTRWNAEIGQYTVDVEAMTALAEYQRVKPGRDFQPKRIPIRLLGNLVQVPDPRYEGETIPELPEHVLWARMSKYQGSRRVCACEDFHLKDRDACEKTGVPYPPDESSIGAWWGRAYVRDYSGPAVRETKRICDPATCAYRADKTCKPQVIFAVMLPFMPRLGTVAKFVTTSWQSYQKIRGSLLQIGQLNQGWLAMLPLEMVVTMETVSAEGYKSPIVHIEYAGDLDALAEETLQTKRRLVGIEQQLKALDAPADMKALDDGEDAKAYAREFSHDTEDLSDFGIDGVLRELSEKAGWSSAKLAAELQKAGDEQVVIDALEAELYGGEEEATDAEFEEEEPFDDPEAEFPPSEYDEDGPPAEAYDAALFADFEEGGGGE